MINIKMSKMSSVLALMVLSMLLLCNRAAEAMFFPSQAPEVAAERRTFNPAAFLDVPVDSPLEDEPFTFLDEVDERNIERPYSTVNEATVRSHHVDGDGKIHTERVVSDESEDILTPRGREMLRRLLRYLITGALGTTALVGGVGIYQKVAAR